MFQGHDTSNDYLLSVPTDPRTGLPAGGQYNPDTGQYNKDPNNPAGLYAPGWYDQYMPGQQNVAANPILRPEYAYLGSSPDFYKQQGQRYADMASAADNRAAPVTNYRDAMMDRGQQMASLGLLHDAAAGQAPSAAAAQYRLGMNQAGAAAGYGLATGGAPTQLARAQQGGMFMGGQGMTQAGMAAANARSAEDQRAIQSYTQGGLGMRQQDIGQENYNANLALQSRNLNDARAMGLLGMEQSTYEDQRNALMQQQAMLARLYAQDTASKQAAQERARQKDEQTLGMVIGGATGGLGSLGKAVG